MINKSGYYSSIKLVMDEQIIQTLLDEANRLSVTPDYIVEQFIGGVLQGRTP
jgi:hypothetical protein